MRRDIYGKNVGRKNVRRDRQGGGQLQFFNRV